MLPTGKRERMSLSQRRLHRMEAADPLGIAGLATRVCIIRLRQPGRDAAARQTCDERHLARAPVAPLSANGEWRRCPSLSSLLRAR